MVNQDFGSCGTDLSVWYENTRYKTAIIIQGQYGTESPLLRSFRFSIISKTGHRKKDQPVIF